MRPQGPQLVHTQHFVVIDPPHGLLHQQSPEFCNTANLEINSLRGSASVCSTNF